MGEQQGGLTIHAERGSSNAAGLELGEGLLVDTNGTHVRVSPECTAVLLAGGLVVGGMATLATEALFASILGTAGFEAIGVEAGSFAAWWQSTFPLAEARSLFSKLQSISMAGRSMVLEGSIVGGAVTAIKIRDICHVVDHIDSESVEGEAVSAFLAAQRKLEHFEQLGEEDWDNVKHLVHEKRLASTEMWESLTAKSHENFEKMKHVSVDKWERFQPKAQERLEKMKRTSMEKWEQMKPKSKEGLEKMNHAVVEKWDHWYSKGKDDEGLKNAEDED